MKINRVYIIMLLCSGLCSCQADLTVPGVIPDQRPILSSFESLNEVHQQAAELAERCRFKFTKEQTLKEVFMTSGLMKSICRYEEAEIKAVYQFVRDGS